MSVSVYVSMACAIFFFSLSLGDLDEIRQYSYVFLSYFFEEKKKNLMGAIRNWTMINYALVISCEYTHIHTHRHNKTNART